MITPEDLFKAEFPGSVMERKKVYIKKESLALLEKKSGAKFKSRMFTFHKAVKNGKIQGYAAFDSHRVRTKEETICILFTPDGMI
ncbi:MAG: hypothetical protein OEZ34_07520, partial [Spirochaetia bacterium]|nr:hypothetical protein [Spirochaetia bacterium]